MGADGWAYADVLPYFRRLERWHGTEGDASWRGTDGPMHITRGEQKKSAFPCLYRGRARRAGYGRTEDYNGERQEGFGAFERTIWQGRRWSAADAYLRPALASGNCTLLRGLVDRIEISDGRASGVRLSDGRLITARGEIVLATGAINSPKILMTSGIGPAKNIW